MLGQDTEYFLWDTEKDQFVPSWTYLPKEKTYLIKGLHAFRDGFAVEINTGPQSCRAYLWEDQRTALYYTRHVFSIPNHIKFINDPLVRIDHLMDAQEEWPEDCRILGCNPTRDAYTGTQKVIKRDPLSIPFRTSGAHMHISDANLPVPVLTVPKAQSDFIKLCDLFIGLPLTVLFGDDLEFERRTLYGTAGEYRPQNYGSYKGIEYRTPSTRLYCHPAVMGLAFGMLRGLVAKHFFELVDKWNPAIEPHLQKAINTGQGAVEMMEELGKLFDFSRCLDSKDYGEEVDNSLAGGYYFKSKVGKRFSNYYNTEIDVLVEQKRVNLPFSADTWFLLKDNIDKSDTPVSKDWEEAHTGALEYFRRWQPERCKDEVVRV